MKNIAKIAALTAVLSVGNIEAKEIKNHTNDNLQNLAKNIIRTDAMHRVSTVSTAETETEPTPAEKAKAKELVETLFELEDYKAMTEYLAKNGETMSKAMLNEAIKNILKRRDLARKNETYKRGRETHYENVVKSNPSYQEVLEDATQEKEEYKHEITILNRGLTRFENLLQKKSIPTAEDFAEKPSTIDQKSPAIVKWEKKYEMEIVVNDEYQAIVVMHNGDIVSANVYLKDLKGIPTLNLTKDGKMVE